MFGTRFPRARLARTPTTRPVAGRGLTTPFPDKFRNVAAGEIPLPPRCARPGGKSRGLARKARFVGRQTGGIAAERAYPGGHVRRNTGVIGVINQI